MKAPDFYLNNYIADELRAAFDKEDVCISYSGDYEPETLNQVHNSCEILFVEEGEADQEMYKEKSGIPGRERVNGGDHRLAIFCGYRWSCSCKAFR